MKIKKIILYETINTILILLLLTYFISSLTPLQKLNTQGANIKPDEERFRFLIIRDDGKTFTTKNISYNWMIEHGLITNGKISDDDYAVAFIVNHFWPQLIYPSNRYNAFVWTSPMIFMGSETGFVIHLQANY